MLALRRLGPAWFENTCLGNNREAATEPEPGYVNDWLWPKAAVAFSFLSVRYR